MSRGEKAKNKEANIFLTTPNSENSEYCIVNLKYFFRIFNINNYVQK